jgi:tetratricopeptide (TPR) repeat protein/tRNA A-37 threonylcarbamoyl transferase component Bud32
VNRMLLNVSTFLGLTDSMATLAATPNECPRCQTISRIAHGLCLSCLLRAGAEEAENIGGDEFAAALDAVNVADTHWRLGNYEILEEIGRGGMGVIYRARQRHSRRIVALKRVLSYHADSRGTLARFRREAEAAASLDHPNILPIYEVGESEDGTSFFSMKYASGGSLQEVGPALRDDQREIVRLMARVTRAVQYAHRQGILHRDLKPGNILLDGRGEPLVSDFGLAKWLDSSSDLTRTLTIFGTPGYIAPEQAEGPAANLKPAADVYSLGAILFDLLSGRPPFLGEHALAVIHQASDKPAPRLRSLVPNTDRDLETICARCLERDPTARYLSAGDLAEDLERWLEGRPIIARPVLPPAQLWRWSRRNPMLAGAAAALVALLLLIGGLFTWHRRAEALAQAELARLRQGVMEFAQMEAQVCQPGEKQMEEDVYLRLSRELGIDAKQLRGKLPPFAAYLKRTPSASAYERANAAYVAKDYGEAERWAAQAASEARKVTPVNANAVIDALELAGLSAQARIQYPRAMQYFREAEKFADANRNSEEWANLHDSIADLLFAQGKYGDAEKQYRSVIEIRSRALGPEHPETLASRNRLIYALNEEEKHAEAEAEARQVVKLREKILGFEHPDTLLSRYNLASALYHEGKFAEAERLYREVLKLDENVIGPEHRRTMAARIGLANTLNDQGKYAEAIPSYRHVIRLDEKVYGREHPVTLNDRMDLATALQGNHQYPAAEAEYRMVIRLQEKVIGPKHAYTLNTRNNLAELLDDEGKFSKAEAECRQIIGLEDKVLGPNHRLTLNSRANLAVAVLGQGRVEEAEIQIGDVMKSMEEKLGLGYPDTVSFTVKFVTGLAHQNRREEAIKIAARAEEGARTTMGQNHPLTQKYAGLLQSLKNPE